MSIQEASTPSSTTGSTAGSPSPSHPPATPLTPDSSDFVTLPTAVGKESNISPVSGAVQGQATATSGPTKRKPSRRANTAERRATHNAVERQRRETLNGRFLDLAALLPNLATVRRPSKSAIVNSSIALIHASRRTRLLAARELRLLSSESDALRRELNEWRARASLPRIDEPTRSQEFLTLISPQDIEGVGGMDSADGAGPGERWWDAEGLGEMGEEERRAYELVMQDGEEENAGEDGEEDFVRMNPAFKSPASAPPANVSASQVHPLGVMQQRQQQQQQLSFARGVAFEGMPSHPGLAVGVHTMYEPSGHPHGVSHALPVHPDLTAMQLSHEKLVDVWAVQQQAQASLLLAQQAQAQVPQWVPGGGSSDHFTPPGTAGGAGSPLGGHPFFLQQTHVQHMYPSPDMDDSSSVGSGDGVAGGGGSAGGSPGPFDMGVTGANMNSNDRTYGRKRNLSLSLPGSGWNTQQQQPLASGGGGGGRHMNAMMAMMM
ncbi:hypothetical protein EW145_g7452 [Phellinidium pouzarii]|uniref:BHLH domain-containing protein n=1 Tax=Phellinidium pouzarii TaxID=167371 RepID=A0A4S4KIU6_9AGAM|nr:hypothetical protein EW145_g7452 [Phellinidium pouzarii]